jgi:S-disulfanyl-L-cysteine oxidoreductase SoxD
MRVRVKHLASQWAGRLCAGLCALGAASSAPAQTGSAAALNQIGRLATPAEVRAWDIDVRADFKGLPKGAGSVALGETVWESKCASCHGAFGESNEVFSPIVGGTTKRDIETGRVANLSIAGFPHRTTLMKVSKLSTLWDYINRAMPWNAPKSLSTDEVYAVLAYILNLGDIVPADFTLSERNMAEVQNRLPNRNGKVFYAPMWDVRAKGDVVNPLCMKNCPVDDKAASTLPDVARNTHGNIAEQVRPFGAPRGTDTAAPPRGTKAGAATATTVAVVVAAATPATVAANTDAAALVKSNGCTACHGMANKVVGPAFTDIAKKYAGTADAVDYLAAKIRNGGQGVWGAIPMPEQAQLKDADTRAVAQWLAGGAK